MITVDGMVWNIPCDITRVSEVKLSDISGMLLNKAIFNDVWGTYLQYDVTLVANPNNMGEYYKLYEILTEPVEGHTFVLPYNDRTVELVGICKPISDEYVQLPNGGAYWKGVTFSIVANGPTKEQTLGQAIKRGLTPLPDVAVPSLGDSYTFTENGWVQTASMQDADNMLF